MANRVKPEPAAVPGERYYVIVGGSRFNECTRIEDVEAALARWANVGVMPSGVEKVTVEYFPVYVEFAHD